jgi:geranylgeranyl transferase type-2 subunit beta
MPKYLEDLTVRLATGVAELPEVVRARHAAYYRAAQRDDGGFAGREGGSDLYYTSFGLRGMSVLGELYGPPAERAATFLRGRLGGRESIVDFLSLIYGVTLLQVSAGIDVFAGFEGDWKAAVTDALEELRREDGGYAKGPEGVASSTYHTFLVLLCLELIGREAPRPEAIVGFLRSQASEEGGFREIRASKRAGTNPTAAAIGALRMLGALDDATRESTLDFLCEMQTDEGGLRANTRIPVADVLSTFTGLVTLIDLEALHEIDAPAVLRYVQSMEDDRGGFQAASLIAGVDVEYTFYGLGSWALLV